MLRASSWQVSCLLTALLTVSLTQQVTAVDLEAFEFNDPDFTFLTAATNSVNNGNNWSTDITTSSVVGGTFFVGKDNDDFETSHLQIDNVTSDTVGSRYIVAEIAGWDIRGFDAANQEQIRFGFLDDDSGTGGSRVAAQVQIARVSDSPTDGLALEGNAIGASSVNIPGTAPLALVRTSPFTMVLEFNKLSDTYEVFYKDDSNPSQSLGMGTIAPDRNGNSLRFVVNNNFGSDFSESFTIDRVALTDSNPLTDLLTLEVDRSSGEVKLINTSGSTLSGITGYTIDSAVGSVDNGQLLPFTGTLNAGQEVVLSSVGGAWVQNPSEDWQAALSLSGGGTRSVNVDFIGNTGERFDVGDLNFDGELTVDDWTIFIAGAEANLSALSTALAYQSGDLDGDGINSIGDFGLFEVAFDAANGGGAFAAMLASVPEPSSLLLGGLACLALVDGRKFRSRCR